MRILVDGYNLIRRIPELALADREDLERGRDALVDALSQYRSGRGHKITVVFDGADSYSQGGGVEKVRGIAVIYSRHGRSADDVIISMCREGNADLLVTADSDLRRKADDSGVPSAHPEFFWDRVQGEIYRMLKGALPEDEEPQHTAGRRRLKKKDRKVKNLLSRL
ncbi:MAG: NYN domain-containing protein [bacterium]